MNETIPEENRAKGQNDKADFVKHTHAPIRRLILQRPHWRRKRADPKVYERARGLGDEGERRHGTGLPEPRQRTRSLSVVQDADIHGEEPGRQAAQGLASTDRAYERLRYPSEPR